MMRREDNPYHQLNGPHQNMGVRISNSMDHTKAWEFVCPTRGAGPKRGSRDPQLKGPLQSVGVRVPNKRSHTEAWGCKRITQGVIQNCGRHSPLQDARRRDEILYAQVTGYTKVCKSVSPTQGQQETVAVGIPNSRAGPNHGSRCPQLEVLHRSVGVGIPSTRGDTKARQLVSLNGRGHTKAWDCVPPTEGPTPIPGLTPK